MPFRYRPEIDGLRAVAVLAVLFCHAGFGFSGGYVGVDVFFVISGYLITALLLRDLENSRFSMIDFWERRVRRIFPALSVVVLATILAGGVFLFSIDYQRLGQSLVTLTAIASNFYFWFNGGYFNGRDQEKAFLHTWSLSVEEQFYLFFPIGLFLLYRFLPHRRREMNLFLVLSLVTLAGLILAALIIRGGMLVAAYFLLPTRAWEMLLGSLLAALPAGYFPTHRLIREGASWLGLGMIAAAAIFYTSETKFPGFAALPPCLGTALLIWGNASTATSGTVCGKILATRPFVAVGLISYSLYLWHWPLYAYARYLSWDGLGVKIILFGLSFVLAALSWKYVESPVRTKRIFGSRRSLFSFFALTSVGF